MIILSKSRRKVQQYYAHESGYNSTIMGDLAMIKRVRVDGLSGVAIGLVEG